MGIRRLGRFLGRLLLLGLAFWAVTFAAVLAVSLLWPRDTALPGRADAIICLGASMSRTDGWDQPGPNSASRARSCAALHAAGVAPVVVFTGYGHSRASVAEAMRATAVDAGLPPEAALLEERARSTIQNAAFSRALVPDARRVVLVSDPFHLPRSWVIFRAMGWPDVALYPSRTAHDPEVSGIDGRSKARWLFRESLAIWANAARALAYLGGGVLGIPEERRIGWFN
ncbi:YdcF family protein [Rhodobacterales bacterium HKCCSP123]|nr:YdcF family protein [Rhodobacterales bacterium HKCCSP123]